MARSGENRVNRYIHYIDVQSMSRKQAFKLIENVRLGFLQLDLFFRSVTREELEKIK